MAKPQETGVSITSTLPGEKIAMGIDAAAVAHIMGVLTDLYTDPELAVLREYSTNARDSHIAAKNPAPIEVQLPTPLAPFLIVRDFGIGLSGQDIANIYSRYGASTKRGNNDETGMLGLGCKSALTYASQFVLVGIKDGRRVQVAISRDEDGAGSMTIVSDEATTEPNGVEVQVPVKPQNSFEAKAAEFFSFWEPGTVLVNGKPPARFDGLKITDDLYVRETKHRAGHVVVMGGVAYPADIVTDLNYGYSFVAFVPIGSVVFTPSREGLQDVPKTQAALRQIAADLKQKVAVAIQDEIDSAPTRGEALRTMLKWRKIMTTGIKKFTYKGEQVPESIEDPTKQGKFILTSHRSYTLSRNQTVSAVMIESLEGALWVEGYDLSKFTANHKRKLQQYCEEKSIEVETYVLVNTLPNTKWIDSNRVIQWEDVNEIKLASVGNAFGGSSRPKGSYDAYVGADNRYSDTILAADIDTTKPIYYMHGGKYTGRGYLGLLKDQHGNDFTFVVMGENRLNKFRRDFPKAKRIREAIQELYDAWAAKLTPSQRSALSLRYHYGAVSNLKRLDPARVDDPALKAAIKGARTNVDALYNQGQKFAAYGCKEIGADSTDPLDGYPLFDARHLDHSYTYANAVYAAGLTNKD